jgi:polar amino acid transport system substrate-binding protein
MRLIQTLPQTLTGASRAATLCVFLAVLLAAISGPPSDAVAQARIACGSFYRVAPGDTLHRIATRAYGSGDYQAIFAANRDILPDISRIAVGDDLLIPCLDGTGPKTRREALALGTGTGAGTGTGGGTPAPEASATAIRPAGGGIGFLTGSVFAPFAHRALPEGGMITELVRLAIARAAPEREVNVTFVDDWSAHLGLLGQGAYDLGFPWYRPDCSKADRLSASMRQRCAGFEFSDPLFEVAIGYYVRAGDPLAGATAYDRLFGRKLCRPAGYFTFDLDQEDLREPNATRIIPPAAADCFTWLMRGEVDVVTLNKSLATAEISKLGLDRRVAEIPALASAQTLHVVAPKGDAEGRAYLDLVNQGLADLQASGRWFEVVSRHLGAFGVWLR